ncbi:TPA: hypothetical protein ACHU7H_001978, partial [Streptococcus suis]
LKKLVKRMAGEPFYFVQMRWFKHQNRHFSLKTVKKTNTETIFVCNLKRPKPLFIFTKDYLAIFAKYSRVRTSCEV